MARQGTGAGSSGDGSTGCVWVGDGRAPCPPQTGAGQQGDLTVNPANLNKAQSLAQPLLAHEEHKGQTFSPSVGRRWAGTAGIAARWSCQGKLQGSMPRAAGLSQGVWLLNVCGSTEGLLHGFSPVICNFVELMTFTGKIKSGLLETIVPFLN